MEYQLNGVAGTVRMMAATLVLNPQPSRHLRKSPAKDQSIRLIQQRNQGRSHQNFEFISNSTPSASIRK
jgi:hypothetical protein